MPCPFLRPVYLFQSPVFTLQSCNLIQLELELRLVQRAVRVILHKTRFFGEVESVL
jgi:hypothetical protein